MKGKFCLLAGITAGLILSGCGNENKEMAQITQITAQCIPGVYGRMVERFVLKTEDIVPLLSLTVQDFTIQNAFINSTEFNDELKVREIYYKEDTIVLEVDPFYIDNSNGQYTYWNAQKQQLENGPEAFSVTCSNTALSFGYAQLSEITTELVDDFTDEVCGTIEYKLFSPENQNEPLPIVIYNHGGGCTEYGKQILDDPFATSFARQEVQQEYPCYIMAPYRDSNYGEDRQGFLKELEDIKLAVDQLIEQGKVDKNRVYMCGESMGSLTTFEFLAQYPGYLAAAIPMNGGPEYDEETNSTPDKYASDENLKKIVEHGTKLMFVQGLGDYLSYPEKFAFVYNRLYDLGAKEGQIVWNAYTDKQFNFLQQDHIVPDDTSVVDPITGIQSYCANAYHNSSRPASNDTYLKNWLFSQSRE